MKKPEKLSELLMHRLNTLWLNNCCPEFIRYYLVWDFVKLKVPALDGLELYDDPETFVLQAQDIIGILMAEGL